MLCLTRMQREEASGYPSVGLCWYVDLHLSLVLSFRFTDSLLLIVDANGTTYHSFIYLINLITCILRLLLLKLSLLLSIQANTSKALKVQQVHQLL